MATIPKTRINDQLTGAKRARFCCGKPSLARARLVLRLAANMVLAGLLLAGGTASAAQPRANARVDYVVLVSIDGLRPDAIFKAPASNLLRLIDLGVYCARTQTIEPIATLPAHTSMLTGLSPVHHGVFFNQYRAGYYQGDTVFSVAKKAGLTTAMLFAKSKLNYLADPRYLDFVHGEPPANDPPGSRTTAARLAAVFEEHWSKDSYNVTFVHMREPDVAGHRQGWMSPGYLDAVVVADLAVGRIVSVIERTRRRARTLLIVTADHGGKGYRHQVSDPETATIPWIMVASGVPKGLRIDRVLHVYDTTPTALAVLGLAMPGAIDGTPVTEALPSARLSRVPGD